MANEQLTKRMYDLISDDNQLQKLPDDRFKATVRLSKGCHLLKLPLLNLDPNCWQGRVVKIAGYFTSILGNGTDRVRPNYLLSHLYIQTLSI